MSCVRDPGSLNPAGSLLDLKPCASLSSEAADCAARPHNESGGIVKIGRTACVNPGSECSDRVLHGALCELDAKKGCGPIEATSGKMSVTGASSQTIAVITSAHIYRKDAKESARSTTFPRVAHYPEALHWATSLTVPTRASTDMQVETQIVPGLRVSSLMISPVLIVPRGSINKT